MEIDPEGDQGPAWTVGQWRIEKKGIVWYTRGSWYCQDSGIRVASGRSLQLGWYCIVMLVLLVLKCGRV